MAYRIHFCWSIAIPSWVASVVVLQLWTLPLEMSLGPALKASSFLTCPGAPLVVSSISICRTPIVTGQMSTLVELVGHLGTFGSTRSVMVIVAFGAQRFRSSVRFLLTRPNSVGSTSVLPLVLLLLDLIVL
ncbi:hypothetical protein Tco_0639640 [Tanacetum coccineum]